MRNYLTGKERLLFSDSIQAQNLCKSLAGGRGSRRVA